MPVDILTQGMFIGLGVGLLAFGLVALLMRN